MSAEIHVDLDGVTYLAIYDDETGDCVDYVDVDPATLTPLFDELQAERRLARIKTERAAREPITRVVDEWQRDRSRGVPVFPSLPARMRDELKKSLGR